MSRRLFIGLVSFAFFGFLALGAWSVIRPRHCINRDGFERIRVGMTEEEVESVLGRPPGDYSTRVHWTFGETHGVIRDWCQWTEEKRWKSDEGEIAVYFDAGCVVHTEYNFLRDKSYLDRFRRRLGL